MSELCRKFNLHRLIGLPFVSDSHYRRPLLCRPQVTDNPSSLSHHGAPAILRKWASLQNERRGTAPYEILNGTLEECLRFLMTKPASTRHLYEIHTLPQPPLVSAVLSGDDVGELARLRDFL
jgi:hypothetical protein